MVTSHWVSWCFAGRLCPAAAWSCCATVGRAVVAGCWGGWQAALLGFTALPCLLCDVFENETFKKKHLKDTNSVTRGEHFPSLARRGGREGRPGGARGALLQRGRVDVHPSRLPRGWFLLGWAPQPCSGHLQAWSDVPGHAALAACAGGEIPSVLEGG